MKTCSPHLNNVLTLPCENESVIHSRNVVTAARMCVHATSRMMIKRTSFSQLSQQIFYSSSFPVLIGKLPYQSPSTEAFWFS